jgi:hypothetical protein
MNGPLASSHSSSPCVNTWNAFLRPDSSGCSVDVFMIVARAAPGLPAVPWHSVLFSLLTGIATHLLWDAFTHRGHFAFVEAALFSDVRVFRVLQHASTLLGSAFLAWWLWRKLRLTPPRADVPQAAPVLRFVAFAAMAVVPLAASLYAFWLLLSGQYNVVFITLGVLGGLALARSGLAWADPALALIVAMLVGRAGYQILRRSIPTLVDERAFDRTTIQREAERVEGVVSAYAIRSRHAGDRRFAELTIAVDGRSNVASAHRIADQVEDRLRDHLQLDEVTVHVEPC